MADLSGLGEKKLMLIDSPKVQYATGAIGVFGPPGQNAELFDTEIEAWRDAHKSGHRGKGPISRKIVVINGEEYTTEWVNLAKTYKEIDDWKEPE